MKFRLPIFLQSALLLLNTFIAVAPARAQETRLRPGFIKEEYLELLKVSSRQGDTLYNPALPAPERFRRIYRSPVMGLDNRWELWLAPDSTVAISIRGTTRKQDSWIENLYAAMVPATGTLQLTNNFTFPYSLSTHPQAAVHTGWLIGTAFISRDLLPRLDSMQGKGFRDILIIGHSQGGAIACLLSAHLAELQAAGKVSNRLRFKTYASAAPKAGNLYFAYDVENKYKGGWAFNVVNAADWVPEAPFSIQKLSDLNKSNPFTEVDAALKKLSFSKRIAARYVYNNLRKPTEKAHRRFQRFLGKSLGGEVRKYLPEFVVPEFFPSSNYVRTGVPVVLYPQKDYYALFPDDGRQIWTHHAFEPYLYLTEKY
jgi:hypothetical protein